MVRARAGAHRAQKQVLALLTLHRGVWRGEERVQGRVEVPSSTRRRRRAATRRSRPSRPSPCARRHLRVLYTPRHSSHTSTHHGRLCSRGCQVSPRPLLPPPPPRLFAPEMGPPSPRHASPPIATAPTRKSASTRPRRATQQPSSGSVATCSATSELTLSLPRLLFVPPPLATGPKPPPLRRPPRPAASRTRRRLSSSPSASSPPPPPPRAGPESAVGQQVAHSLSVSLCAQLGPGCRVRPSLAASTRANRR